MSDQNIETDLTPEDAEKAVEALEKAVIDGEDVTVTQLTEARERLSWAKLRRQGAERKAETQKARDAELLRGKTKREVADLFNSGGFFDPVDAYDEAVAALERLGQVIESNKALLNVASTEFSRGGVPARSNWGEGTEPEHFDRANFAVMAQGNETMSITVDGVQYGQEHEGLWVRAAVQAVAQSRGGLPLPYGSNLQEIVRGDLPATLRVALSERVAR
ncbi:hypothetical protein B7R21_09850 [Subtercola boreus]|uniref:Uncharacterized protein n=1 Tax=Subtercola boreus TaxID=120213 RepID=A0A3E0VSR0_9MICO|nr:hypothetical protein [Subtercola boreus]RFA12640.1 hypothetical protein B7R21_09850 [Subtercola boreus]